MVLLLTAHFGKRHNLSQLVGTLLTLEGMKKKSYTKASGRGSIGPPSIFKSIQPIDMKLGMCNKCPVYFQLSVVTWHLIGFHGNGSIKK